MKTSATLYRFYIETAEDQDSQGNKIKGTDVRLVWTNLTLRQAQTLNKLVDENLSYHGRPASRFGWEEI